MKKLSIIVGALLVAGAVSSWAAETDKILAGPVPITLSGKLSGATLAKGSTTVAGTDIDGTALEMAEVQFISGTSTDQPFFVIGSSIGTSNVVSGGSTDVHLVGTSVWFGEDSVTTKTGKGSETTVIGFAQDQSDLFTGDPVTNAQTVISNSFLAATLTFKVSKSGTNVTGKFTGIWKDDVSAVNGTIKTTKTKK